MEKIGADVLARYHRLLGKEPMEADQTLVEDDIGGPVDLEGLGVRGALDEDELDGVVLEAQAVDGVDEMVGALEVPMVGGVDDAQGELDSVAELLDSDRVTLRVERDVLQCAPGTVEQLDALRLASFLGLLIDGKRSGLIPTVEPLLDELHDLGFRLSSSTRAAVLQFAREL